VAGSSMLERGGGEKAPWWSVAACLREAEEGGQEELVVAGSHCLSWWLEVGANGMRGAGRGTKHVKNP
jgi:hypothetical protein